MKRIVTINVPVYGEKVYRASVGGYDRPFKGWQPTDYEVEIIDLTNEGCGCGFLDPTNKRLYIFAAVTAGTLAEIKKFYKNKNEHCPRWHISRWN
jgi:hypothetical protein